MKTFLREPLVHFLFLGGLLFAIFALVGQSTGDNTGRVIVVTPGMVENLKVSAVRAGATEPDAKATQKLIDDFVREEVLCREARALGIDRDDTVVRTILVERMGFIAEGGAQLQPPSDQDLDAFCLAHPEQFKNLEGHPATADELHTVVLYAWKREQKKAAIESAYAKMRQRYKVKVELAATTPTGVR